MPNINNIPTTQYIGPKIVPHLWNPIVWDATTQYDALAVVQHNGDGYVSRYIPPVGTPPTDDEYWVKWSDFNAQLAQLQQTVNGYDDRIETVEAEIDSANNSIASEITARENAVSAVSSSLNEHIIEINGVLYENVLMHGVKNDGSADVSTIVNNLTNTYNLYFPAGTYRLDSALNIKKSIRGFGYNKLFDNSGTVFKSNITTDQSIGVINIGTIQDDSIFISGITVICNSNEYGIKYTPNKTSENLFISECSIWNCNTTGIHASSTVNASRGIQIDNCSVWHKTASPTTYNNSVGIYIGQNLTDAKISNCEIMSFKVGIRCYSFIQINDTHVWCAMNFNGTTELWRDSIAYNFVCDAVCTNIYADSAFVAVSSNGHTVVCRGVFVFYSSQNILPGTWAITPFSSGNNGIINVDGAIIDDAANILIGLGDHIENTGANIIIKNAYVKTNRSFNDYPRLVCKNNEQYTITPSGESTYTEIAKIFMAPYSYIEFDIVNRYGYKSTIKARSENSSISFIKESHYAGYGISLYYTYANGILTIYARSGTEIYNIKPIIFSEGMTRFMNYNYLRNRDNTIKALSSVADATLIASE